MEDEDNQRAMEKQQIRLFTELLMNIYMSSENQKMKKRKRNSN